MASITFLAALAVLLTLDAITTAYAITHNLAREANPVVVTIMDELGVRAGLFAVKVACFALAVYWVDGISGAVRIGIVALYVAVVVWNIYNIYKARKV